MTASGILRLRLILAAVGFAIWATGARASDNRIMWAGLAVMFLSVLGRFLRPRAKDGDE
jgi:hypothetical protein